nr:hypothetical protein [Azospirillum agricola]
MKRIGMSRLGVEKLPVQRFSLGEFPLPMVAQSGGESILNIHLESPENFTID